MDRFQYLILLTGCLVLTLPLEFLFAGRVWRRPRRLVRALAPPFVVFVAWDFWATAQGHWSFNPRNTTGLRLPYGVPVDELLFFVAIPISALLTLEAVRNVLAGRVRLRRRAPR